MIEELKPCPFCGCEAKTFMFLDETMVMCSSCGVSGVGKTIEAWNKRIPEPNTSVIRWTRYDGKEETLPEKCTDVIVNDISGFKYPAYRFFDSMYWKCFHCCRNISIGDMWAYIPTREGM